MSHSHLDIWKCISFNVPRIQFFLLIIKHEVSSIATGANDVSGERRAYATSREARDRAAAAVLAPGASATTPATAAPQDHAHDATRGKWPIY